MITGQRYRDEHRRPRRTVVDDDSLLARTNGKNRRLRRIDDRVEMSDTVHAEIGNREGAALEILCLQGSRFGTRDETRRLVGNLDQTFPVRGLYDRCDQAGFEGDGDGDVRVVESPDYLPVVLDVAFGDFDQRHRGRFDEEVVDRHFRSRILGIDLLTQGEQRVEPAVYRQSIMGRGLLGLLQPVGNRLTHAAHRGVDERMFRRRQRLDIGSGRHIGYRRRPVTSELCGFDVGLDDATVPAACATIVQIDTQVRRQATCEWGRRDVRVIGLRRAIRQALAQELPGRRQLTARGADRLANIVD